MARKRCCRDFSSGAVSGPDTRQVGQKATQTTPVGGQCLRVVCAEQSGQWWSGCPIQVIDLLQPCGQTPSIRLAIARAADEVLQSNGCAK